MALGRWLKHSSATSRKLSSLKYNKKIRHFNYLSFCSKDKLNISRFNVYRPSEKPVFVEHLWVIYSYCWFNAFTGLSNAVKMIFPLSPWDSRWWQSQLYNNKLNSTIFVSTVFQHSSKNTLLDPCCCWDFLSLFGKLKLAKNTWIFGVTDL